MRAQERTHMHRQTGRGAKAFKEGAEHMHSRIDALLAKGLQVGLQLVLPQPQLQAL